MVPATRYATLMTSQRGDTDREDKIMGKRKGKAKKETVVQETVAVMRRGNYRDKVEAMRDGRRERAATFTDRRREASRNACRGRVVA